jgi:hypothetical protein
MQEPLPIPELLEEWFKWVQWITDPNRDESKSDDFIGFAEFDGAVQSLPEHAWKAILAALLDPRLEPHLGVLAASPLEDLLSYHSAAFIDRVEHEARIHPKFAYLLGGVWKFQMSDEVWSRVQAVWERRGWNGIPSPNA